MNLKATAFHCVDYWEKMIYIYICFVLSISNYAYFSLYQDCLIYIQSCWLVHFLQLLMFSSKVSVEKAQRSIRKFSRWVEGNNFLTWYATILYEIWYSVVREHLHIILLLLLLLLHFWNMSLCIGYWVLDEMSYCQSEILCYCHVCYISFVEENRVFVWHFPRNWKKNLIKEKSVRCLYKIHIYCRWIQIQG
jgi:hypothetical protein